MYISTYLPEKLSLPRESVRPASMLSIGTKEHHSAPQQVVTGMSAAIVLRTWRLIN